MGFLMITYLQYALDMQSSQLEKVCFTPLISDGMLCRWKRVANAAMMIRFLFVEKDCLCSYQETSDGRSTPYKTKAKESNE